MADFMFKETPAAWPTVGVIIFLILLAMAGWWFWFGLGVIGSILLCLGSQKPK